MTEPNPESNDPGRNPEDEGIPDLQDGWPKAQQAEDPQQMPVPGDRPVAAESHGTTPSEQREGESLDARLAQEEPDVDEETGAAGTPDPEAGQISDERLPGTPSGDHLVGHESPAAGLPAEERALHIESMDEADAPPSDPEENPADEQR
ncbi:hypothetical protein JJV70_07710 [Streptomyces sp. JJ66]|uniref:hypothetical protein n=1 Tax=Streptomyces sp. JJ66 TaxID=2803843 RepID=UPI001C567D28|nr:hypothetical protein [Streptomyces sp. JJ66]MBW1602000.1 hypothetical protein [Streptomyces sp. JJ66]